MIEQYRWVIYALLGALFAAVSNVLSKPALDAMEVGTATVVRAVVMVLVLALVTSVMGQWRTLTETPLSAWVLISFAGVAAGLSWWFGYGALQLTTVNNSYPIDKLSLVFAVLLAVIFLGERPSVTNWVGIGIMLVGGYLVTRDG